MLNYFLDFYQSNKYHDYINSQAIKSELAISIYFNSSFPKYNHFRKFKTFSNF